MPRENFLLRVWCSENICYVYLLSCCDCVGLDVYYYCKIKIHDKEIWIIGGITKNQDRVETIISGYQSWVCWHLQLPDKLWIHIIKRSGVLKCCQGFWSQQSFHGLQDDQEGVKVVSRVKRPIKPSRISFWWRYWSHHHHHHHHHHHQCESDVGSWQPFSVGFHLWTRVSLGFVRVKAFFSWNPRGGEFLFLIKTLSTMTHMQIRSLVFQQEVCAVTGWSQLYSAFTGFRRFLIFLNLFVGSDGFQGFMWFSHFVYSGFVGICQDLFSWFSTFNF